MLTELRSLMPTALADKIDAAASAIQGERREVSVLLLDVTNFTAASHRMDSEDVYLVIDEAMRFLVDIVYRYEGTIDKFTGDGLVALFGAPVAHEDDPERAIRAALEMLERLQPFRQQTLQTHDFDFKVRIGINTGQVIAGQLGSNLHMEYTVIGDTVDLAYALEGAAEPGTILTSFSTYQRTRPLFNYVSLPALKLKGFDEPVRAFRPLGQREQPGSIRGLPGLRVPMIGRNRDLAKIHEQLQAVRAQETRQMVLVTGDAGLGKSRLVSEFVGLIDDLFLPVYQGNCLAYTRNRAMSVVGDLIRNIVQISETDPVALQQQLIQRFIREIQLPAEEVLPYLFNVLSIPQLNAQAAARLRLLDATMLQKQTHAVLRQLLLTVAAMPSVFVFEDLHWIDPASREFLEFFIQTSADAPLLLVLVSRDFERQTAIRSVINVLQQFPGHFEDIRLKALSAVENRTLVDQLIPESSASAEVVKTTIIRRAEGNPFYTEELVRMLIDAEALIVHDGNLILTARAEDYLKEVPGTLGGLIMARFDQLQTDLRHTLQKAAILGRTFPVRLLEKLWDGSQSELSTQLAQLVEKHFLLEEPFGTEQGFVFRHTLIQEAVYGTLLRRDRQRLHGLVANVIEQETHWQADDRVEVLAYHYAESSSPDKAIPYLVSAAETAARRSAYETAAKHHRTALELLQKHPQDEESFFFRIHIGLGQAYKYLGDYRQAEDLLHTVQKKLLLNGDYRTDFTCQPYVLDTLREVADILHREGKNEDAFSHLTTALEVIEASAEATVNSRRLSILERMAWVLFRQNHIAKAYEVASSAIENLHPQLQNENLVALASLYNTLGGISWQKNEYDRAAAYVEKSLEINRQVGYTWGVANAHTNLGVLHYTLGNWTRAARDLEAAGMLAQSVGDRQFQALNLNNLGFMRIATGNFQQAEDELQTSLAIRMEIGDTWGIGHSRLNLALLAVNRENYAEGMEHAQACLAAAEATADSELTIRSHTMLGLCLGHQHEFAPATAHISDALTHLENHPDLEMESEAIRVRGVLERLQGDIVHSELSFQEAAELAKHSGSIYYEALALMELGRLHAQQLENDPTARTEWRMKAQVSLNRAESLLKKLQADHHISIVRALRERVHSSFVVEVSALNPLAEPQANEPFPETLESDAEQARAIVVWLQVSSVAQDVAQDVAQNESQNESQNEEMRIEAVRALGNKQTGTPEVPPADIRWYRLRAVVASGVVAAGEIGPHAYRFLLFQGGATAQAKAVLASVPAGGVIITRHNLALLLTDQGRTATAFQQFQLCITEAAALHAQYHLFKARLGKLPEAQEILSAVSEEARKSLEIAKRSGNPSLELSDLYVLIECTLAIGDASDSQRGLRQAIHTLPNVWTPLDEDPIALLGGQGTLRESAETGADEYAARGLLRRACRIFAEVGANFELQTVNRLLHSIITTRL